ncbi:hypothetical protein EG359_02320 [Chryseobacterium joostei]|uniref:Uncharacterized protein n=1 Tax=Chryseobacterium joostei TaxID=112234 RepID=A0A1N7ILZ6_9FLAO|nr:hypothetical protein [Chryseobacterium joostei]AZA98510.1 hypothetical protein EG359_02320 [Chryseobacterium joostei]SIS38117.1 hypothetical protein SAMN05421768_10662 [Chryseobacterium joostei]
MIKAYINNQELSADALHYDQWFYKKYNENKAVYNFSIIIPYDDFVQKLKPNYEQLIEELTEDDRLHNENFFLDSYGISDYPFFEEVIKNAEEENYKIDFLSSFFAEQIFSTYVNTKSADKWIIRKLTKIDNDGKEVFINDEVQQMD